MQMKILLALQHFKPVHLYCNILKGQRITAKISWSTGFNYKRKKTIMLQAQNVATIIWGNRKLCSLVWANVCFKHGQTTVVNISQHSCPKTKTIPINCLRTTLRNFFDPLQMLTTVFTNSLRKINFKFKIYSLKISKKHEPRWGLC